jgi:uncharacterized protein involved in exopolysaccharide biosynthesis
MLMRTNEARSTFDDKIEPRWNESGSQRNVGATLNLRGVWSILRFRTRLIATVTIATIVVAAAALVVLPPKYRATARRP